MSQYPLLAAERESDSTIRPLIAIHRNAHAFLYWRESRLCYIPPPLTHLRQAQGRLTLDTAESVSAPRIGTGKRFDGMTVDRDS